MASEWTEIDYTTTLRRIPPQSVTLSVARTFPVDVDECHPIDAKPRLADGGEDIAHVQAHDFRQAQARAKGEAECDVVARVGGRDGEQGGLFGAGERSQA